MVNNMLHNHLIKDFNDCIEMSLLASKNLKESLRILKNPFQIPKYP